MQPLQKTHRKQGAQQHTAWIAREDGTVREQTIRTRPGLENVVWTILDTGEDVWLQNSPDPYAPTIHVSEPAAVEDAISRLDRQIEGLEAKKQDLMARSMVLEGGANG